MNQLWGQSYDKRRDVQRIVKEKAWYIAHDVCPGAEEYVWPSIYNGLMEALEQGAEQAARIAPLSVRTKDVA